MSAAASPRDSWFPYLGPEGFMRIAYREWGDPLHPRVVICVHGFSRNAKDFDVLGRAWGERCRLIAVDLPGRGGSDWLADKSLYRMSLYIEIAGAIILVSGAREVDWVGTSLGGIIGMHLAAQAHTPLRRLVMNDIGPYIPAEGRADNFKHLGEDPRFETLDEAIAYTKRTRAAFGPMSEAAWRALTQASLRRLDDGRLTLHYDPGLKRNAMGLASTEAWPVWDAIAIPTLAIWGTDSKILTADTVAEMGRRGPRAEIIEVPGVGHAPPIGTPPVLAAMDSFLFAGEAAAAGAA